MHLKVTEHAEETPHKENSKSMLQHKSTETCPILRLTWLIVELEHGCCCVFDVVIVVCVYVRINDDVIRSGERGVCGSSYSIHPQCLALPLGRRRSTAENTRDDMVKVKMLHLNGFI